MSDHLPEIVTRFVGDARPLIAATAEARAAIKAYAEDTKKYSAEQTATVRQSQKTQADEVRRYQAEQAAALKRYQAEQKASTAQFTAEQNAEVQRFNAEQLAAQRTTDSEKAAELARFREEGKAATARYNAEQLAATRRYTAEQNALIKARYAEQKAMAAKAAEESGAQKALTKVVGKSPIGEAVGGEAFMGLGAGGMAIGAGAVVGAGLLAASYESLKAAANFEQATTRLMTSAGETHQNIELVRKGLVDMSAQVGVSAQDLAKAMYTVESGSFHGADGLKVLRAAVEGAKAENADLGKVTDAVTTILVDYHLKADDAAMVTTKLVAATSAGKTTFEELTGAMHSVMPIASAAHISINDILGDLAAMTIHGYSAQQATQNLADVIRHMQSPTSIQAKELALLGMTTNQLADDLQSKGLSGTLGEISDRIRKLMPPGSEKVILDMKTALNGLSPAVRDLGMKLFDGTTTLTAYNEAAKALDPISAKQAQSFATLAGSMHRIGDQQMTGRQVLQNYGQALYKATGDATGLNVALMLTGDNAGTAADAIKTVTDATTEAGNHVKGWSDIQSTLNQQIQEFKAWLEALGIKIGDFLMPKVKDLIDIGKHFVGGLKDIFKDDHTLDDLSGKLDHLWKDILPELKKGADDILKSIKDNKDGLEKWGKFIKNDLIPVLAIALPVAFKIIVWSIEGLINIWSALGYVVDGFVKVGTFVLKTFLGVVFGWVDAILISIDKLVNAIPGVPKSWKTNLDNAVNDFHHFRDGVMNDIDSLDGKQIRITTYHNDIYGVTYTSSSPSSFYHGMATGGIRRAAVGMIIPPSDPGTVLTGEPQTGGEVLTPLRGISQTAAMHLTQVVGNAYGFDVTPRQFSVRRGGSGGGPSAGSGSQQPIVIHAQIDLDGRKVYEGIIPHAQRHKGRNPTTALV